MVGSRVVANVPVGGAREVCAGVGTTPPFSPAGRKGHRVFPGPATRPTSTVVVPGLLPGPTLSLTSVGIYWVVVGQFSKRGGPGGRLLL